MALMAFALVVGGAGAPVAARAADKDAKAAGAVGQYVDIAPIAAPIVLNGRLINYIFLTVRLDIAPNVDVSKIRDREPFFRDALVRAAYRKPFVKPGDYTHVDEGALTAAVMSDAVRLAGAHVVTRVEILNAQPQRIYGLPTGPATSAPGGRAPIP